MKFAFLPNYFKKIGIFGFFAVIAIIIISVTITMINAMSLISGMEGESFSESYRLGQELGRSFVTANHWLSQLSSILLLLSIACYMLAKEKVDDEYMDVIRWESLRLSIIICIGVAILFVVLNWNMPAKSILFIQFVSYLITFKIKKSQAIE
jgi:hypothetical protein